MLRGSGSPCSMSRWHVRVASPLSFCMRFSLRVLRAGVGRMPGGQRDEGCLLGRVLAPPRRGGASGRGAFVVSRSSGHVIDELRQRVGRCVVRSQSHRRWCQGGTRGVGKRGRKTAATRLPRCLDLLSLRYLFGSRLSLVLLGSCLSHFLVSSRLSRSGGWSGWLIVRHHLEDSFDGSLFPPARSLRLPLHLLLLPRWLWLSRFITPLCCFLLLLHSPCCLLGRMDLRLALCVPA
mmetsp:Transcript_9833/g.23499  ORF Transcript_9833/g.23499 Transcript_9833/m.23499 type:complete len:235 (+) Transcript_9833:877-1581(+)